MFISRVEMPWPTVQNPYEIHRHLWLLFTNEALKHHEQNIEDKRRGFLFRIESYQTGSPARFLVQSYQRPISSALIKTLGCREFNPQPQATQQLAFLLTANPIKTITDTQKDAKPKKAPNKRGQFKCRVPLVHEEQQRNWLSRHLEAATDIEAVTILPHPPLYFRKGQQSGKVTTVTFEGVLRVREPDILIQMLENGIGPAKSFGCGLLLVRRISA